MMKKKKNPPWTPTPNYHTSISSKTIIYTRHLSILALMVYAFREISRVAITNDYNNHTGSFYIVNFSQSCITQQPPICILLHNTYTQRYIFNAPRGWFVRFSGTTTAILLYFSPCVAIVYTPDVGRGKETTILVYTRVCNCTIARKQGGACISTAQVALFVGLRVCVSLLARECIRIFELKLCVHMYAWVFFFFWSSRRSYYWLVRRDWTQGMWVIAIEDYIYCVIMSIFGFDETWVWHFYIYVKIMSSVK